MTATAMVLAASRVLPQGSTPAPPGTGPRVALHTTVRLAAERTHARPGDTLWLGLDLRMAPGWHTYWKQAGDAGGPTRVRWILPPGLAADSIRWPLPRRFQLADVVSYGYEDSTLLAVPVAVPATTAPGTTLAIAADVDWIECENICIPGAARVALTVPVRAAPGVASTDAARFAAARAAWPLPLPAGARASARVDVPGYRLDVRGLGRLEAPEFLAALPFHVTHGAPQRALRRGEVLTLSLTRPDRVAPVASLPGLLLGTRPGGGRVGWEFTAHVDGVTAPAATAAAPPGTTPAPPPSIAATPAGGSPPAPSSLTLWAALALAFAGGVLLNLMPCVLPVIALKVFSFVERGGEDPRAVRRHGLAFAGGVVATFLALAAALLALRAGGAQLGWGFQLQSPAFVAGLAALCFVLGLSLLGVVEIGAELTRLGGTSTGDGVAGSFANGVLATVVATPCTAPMMGAALGYGLAASAAAAFGVFAALGLGMALPYVALATWPALARRLPRPGAWMLTLKRLLALPMFGTVAWLAWVFAQQAGAAGLGPLAVALGAAGLGAWLVGHAGMVSATSTTRLVRRLAGMAFLAIGGVVAWGASATRPVGRATEEVAPVTDEYGLVWEPWSEAAVARHRADGRPVFVDFTAAWCLTCKVNERVAFASAALRDDFARRGVALLRADWTSRSDAIARAVAGFGRQGIPLYVLYPADRDRPHALLPEVITPGVVRRYLAATLGTANRP